MIPFRVQIQRSHNQGAVSSRYKPQNSFTAPSNATPATSLPNVTLQRRLSTPESTTSTPAKTPALAA
jgi:hypothetical protein